jgi:hypothetical protein
VTLSTGKDGAEQRLSQRTPLLRTQAVPLNTYGTAGAVLGAGNTRWARPQGALFSWAAPVRDGDDSRASEEPESDREGGRRCHHRAEGWIGSCGALEATGRSHLWLPHLGSTCGPECHLLEFTFHVFSWKQAHSFSHILKRI